MALAARWGPLSHMRALAAMQEAATWLGDISPDDLGGLSPRLLPHQCVIFDDPQCHDTAAPRRPLLLSSFEVQLNLPVHDNAIITARREAQLAA